jgi:hypothetical protein
VIPWSEARPHLADTFTGWPATVHPASRLQIRPVLAVWVDGALHSTTNPDTRNGVAGHATLAGEGLRCCPIKRYRVTPMKAEGSLMTPPDTKAVKASACP